MSAPEWYVIPADSYRLVIENEAMQNGYEHHLAKFEESAIVVEPLHDHTTGVTSWTEAES